VKDFTSKFPVGAVVKLAAPQAQIVGVTHRGGPDGRIATFYILAINGQIVENVGEIDILEVVEEHMILAQPADVVDAADEAQQG
jgi:hypothetical protein